MWEKDEVGVGQPLLGGNDTRHHGGELSSEGKREDSYRQEQGPWKHRQIVCGCTTNCTMRNNMLLQIFKEVHNHHVF